MKDTPGASLATRASSAGELPGYVDIKPREVIVLNGSFFEPVKTVTKRRSTVARLRRGSGLTMKRTRE